MMKSFLYALVAILYLQFAQLNAQKTVPNGSFEEWKDQEPIDWTYLFHYAGFQNVFQSNDAREGSYTAELKSLLFQFLEGYPSANLLSDTFDITVRPEMLEG